MALKGIRVVEMLGLAPGPFCGMLLAEFGASVTLVDKIEPSPMTIDILGSGKQHIAINLKDKRGVKIVKDMCKNSDVLLEPFRPGVMEKLGLGPEVLMAENPKLIYARLTGYGQDGPMRLRAGHDINYVALSGFLSMLGGKSSNPFPPINYAADFAGGGLLCAFGILAALFERTSSNKGQIVDASMTEGTAYISSWLYRSKKHDFLWGQEKGCNTLDGGAHFYDTYKTKDGKFMAVGAIEPQFYRQLLIKLDYPIDENEQFYNFEQQKKILSEIFLTKTREEWTELFKDVDACVTPVMDLEEAPLHPQNAHRKAFVKNHEGINVPTPSPKLNRTPGVTLSHIPPSKRGEHTKNILTALQYTEEQIRQLDKDGIVYIMKKSNL